MSGRTLLVLAALLQLTATSAAERDACHAGKMCDGDGSAMLSLSRDLAFMRQAQKTLTSPPREDNTDCKCWKGRRCCKGKYQYKYHCSTTAKCARAASAARATRGHMGYKGKHANQYRRKTTTTATTTPTTTPTTTTTDSMPISGQYCTQTQGGYTGNGAPNRVMNVYFSDIYALASYPSGLILGGNGDNTNLVSYYIQLLNAADVENLPTGGGTGQVLTTDYPSPIQGSPNINFASQVRAAQLNVDFGDEYIGSCCDTGGGPSPPPPTCVLGNPNNCAPPFAPFASPPLGDLYYGPLCGFPEFTGLKIRQVLELANMRLGGAGDTSISVSRFTDAMDLVNNAFVDCKPYSDGNTCFVATISEGLKAM